MHKKKKHSQSGYRLIINEVKKRDHLKPKRFPKFNFLHNLTMLSHQISPVVLTDTSRT